MAWGKTDSPELPSRQEPNKVVRRKPGVGGRVLQASSRRLRGSAKAEMRAASAKQVQVQIKSQDGPFRAAGTVPSDPSFLYTHLEDSPSPKPKLQRIEWGDGKTGRGPHYYPCRCSRLHPPQPWGSTGRAPGTRVQAENTAEQSLETWVTNWAQSRLNSCFGGFCIIVQFSILPPPHTGSTPQRVSSPDTGCPDSPVTMCPPEIPHRERETTIFLPSLVPFVVVFFFFLNQ